MEASAITQAIAEALALLATLCVPMVLYTRVRRVLMNAGHDIAEDAASEPRCKVYYTAFPLGWHGIERERWQQRFFDLTGVVSVARWHE